MSEAMCEGNRQPDPCCDGMHDKGLYKCVTRRMV